MKNIAAILGAASLALALPAAPALAGGDITNFNVKNCTSERMFVCSFDKTDNLMNIPYKARGIQPNERKEFGCATFDRCKVIIGVSKKTSKRTLSSGMEAALAAGAVGTAGVAGMIGAATATTTIAGGSMMVFVDLSGGYGVSAMASASTVTAMTAAAGVAAAIAVAAAGSVAGIEIADGWKDGDVCNEVRKAAQKAGMKPKSFMKDGKVYQVIEQYATDENGNAYLNPDGTAVFSYVTERDRGKCPNPLTSQLVRD